MGVIISYPTGMWVVGLRMPGHGTAPSGLRYISRQEMAAAVRLGMTHLAKQAPDKPVYMIGYSTGEPLALEFALDTLEGTSAPVPASLVLISAGLLQCIHLRLSPGSKTGYLCLRV